MSTHTAPEVERPTDSCGCGHEVIWINGHWEHNVARSIWGGDHDIDTHAPEGEARKQWDNFDLGLPIGGITVPPFEMDVMGEYTGRPYPEQHEYRINMIQSDEGCVLGVETSSGSEVREFTLSPEEMDGILKAAQTDHSLDAYGDDWKFPVGMDRVITWDIGDGENDIRLSQGQIEEIADWCEYALGLSEWTGGDTWEER